MFRTTPDFETVCSQLGINPLEGYTAPEAKVLKLTKAQKARADKKYRQTFGAEPLPAAA